MVRCCFLVKPSIKTFGNPRKWNITSSGLTFHPMSTLLVILWIDKNFASFGFVFKLLHKNRLTVDNNQHDRSTRSQCVLFRDPQLQAPQAFRELFSSGSDFTAAADSDNVSRFHKRKSVSVPQLPHTGTLLLPYANCLRQFHIGGSIAQCFRSSPSLWNRDLLSCLVLEASSCQFHRDFLATTNLKNMFLQKTIKIMQQKWPRIAGEWPGEDK